MSYYSLRRQRMAQVAGSAAAGLAALSGSPAASAPAASAQPAAAPPPVATVRTQQPAQASRNRR